MGQGYRRGFTAAEKMELWDRWQRGESLKAIGRAFGKSRDERKKIEMKFAHVKSHHGFGRLRLRGLSGARDECHLAAIVQNLKTIAKYNWRPPRDAMLARAA